VLDGIVAGEGEGPLAPRDVALGVVLAGLDPIALDLAAVELMGFDADRIPKIRESMAASRMRVTAVRSRADVEVAELDAEGRLLRRGLDDLPTAHSFSPHSGWQGHIERRTSRPAEAM
jgi:uncharacterized protein (DUF362 family)